MTELCAEFGREAVVGLECVAVGGDRFDVADELLGFFGWRAHQAEGLAESVDRGRQCRDIGMLGM